jgi:hypothetical protein
VQCSAVQCSAPAGVYRVIGSCGETLPCKSASGGREDNGVWSTDRGGLGSRVEYSGVEYSRVEYSGVEYSRVWSIVGWSIVEWSIVE